MQSTHEWYRRVIALYSWPLHEDTEIFNHSSGCSLHVESSTVYKKIMPLSSGLHGKLENPVSSFIPCVFMGDV